MHSLSVKPLLCALTLVCAHATLCPHYSALTLLCAYTNYSVRSRYSALTLLYAHAGGGSGGGGGGGGGGGNGRLLRHAGASTGPISQSLISFLCHVLKLGPCAKIDSGLLPWLTTYCVTRIAEPRG